MSSCSENKSRKGTPKYDLSPKQIEDVKNTNKEDEFFKINPTKSNAYVWLLMGNYQIYYTGIFVSAASIKRTNPNADLVVMITPEIPQKIIDVLKKIVTHVVRVPVLVFKTFSYHERDYQLWLSTSYTKWNALALPYKKVIFMDADTIAFDSLDSLFDLPTPAAPFNDTRLTPHGSRRNYYNSNDKDNQGFLKHGSLITVEEITIALGRTGVLDMSTVLCSSTVVLSPDEIEYRKYLQYMNTIPVFTANKCLSTADEQSIAMFYSIHLNKPWYNVHHAYNFNGWKTKPEILAGHKLVVLHYATPEKPWEFSVTEVVNNLKDKNIPSKKKYPDIITWFQMAAEACLVADGLDPAVIGLNEDEIDLVYEMHDSYLEQFSR
jgi:hypothetical protein